MWEIKLNHINKKLKLKTECDQEVIDQIEEYINENYERHNLENTSIPKLEISNLLLINAVFEVLTLRKEKDKNFERIKSILSKI